MMISIQQCRQRLELEHRVLVHELQEAERRGEHLGEEPARRKQAQRLQLVEQALQRLAVGQYGICRHCRQPIAEERLAARPEADMCVSCQGQLERTVITPAGRAYAGRSGR